MFGFIINFALTTLAEVATGLGINATPVLDSYVLGLDSLLMPYGSGMHLVAFTFGGIY